MSVEDLLTYEITAGRSGAPVLLLRPIAGGMALWGEFRDELARDRTVISCDLRDRSRATSTRALAREVACLVERLGVSRVHVFGLSFGGMIATWFAIDRPELVSGLVLASTPARGLAVARSAWRHRHFAPCLVRGRGAREACLAEHVLSERFRRDQPARVSAILAALKRQGGSLRGLLVRGFAAAHHDPGPALAGLRAPTLCLAGELDELVGPDGATELARRLPCATVELVPEAGHDLSLECPRELATRVTAFLGRCEAGR